MKKIWYSVAMSLDGYIAGPNGEYDWIIMDPAIEFSAIMDRFDTLLMGRKTYELTQSAGKAAAMPGKEIVVVSSTMTAEESHPDVTVIADDVIGAVQALKNNSEKDIWLFGGGILFRALLEAGLVDVVEVAIIPILLGGGIPLLPGAADHVAMELEDVRTYPTGIVMLRYAIAHA